ncbi:aldo/keto reductase [bacterium]|nr:aldo/keto reductase [bacterium]
MKRRDFVTTAALGAAGAAAAVTGCSGGGGKTGGSMSYAILGKTGMRVSRLSFGSHLSKENIADPEGRDRQIQLGIRMGINLFDIYNNLYFQYEPMAKSLAGHPETFVSLYLETEKVEEEVDRVLRLFNREAIDLYRAMAEPAKLEGLMKLREKGKVRAVGMAHHWEEEFVRAIRQYGDDLDYFMFPYNFVHNKATPNDKQNSYASFLKLAKDHNYGLIGMKPFCNEMLVSFAKEQGFIGGQKDRGVSVPAAAIRHALSTGAIHTSLPAMNSEREVTENLQGVFQPKLTDREKEVLEEIDLLAMEHKWAYLDRKPQYRWLADWVRPGVFTA